MKEIINLGTYNPNKVSKRNGFHFETQLGSKSKIHKSNKIYCRKRNKRNTKIEIRRNEEGRDKIWLDG